jgi:hypothetical protein
MGIVSDSFDTVCSFESPEIAAAAAIAACSLSSCSVLLFPFVCSFFS